MLQCMVMFACLVIGALGICPDHCCNDPRHSESSLAPVEVSEAHHFCTMLACGHCSSFIAATSGRPAPFFWTRHPPLLQPNDPDQPFGADFFRPPISFPI